MTTVGLRELRQQASELVRRAEAGEEMTITVSGRPSARLGPVARRSWREWDEIEELFAGPADESWEHDRAAIEQTLVDRWPGA